MNLVEDVAGLRVETSVSQIPKEDRGRIIDSSEIATFKEGIGTELYGAVISEWIIGDDSKD